MSTHDDSKRRFLKTAGYIAPAILTLKAVPSFASSGSGYLDGHRNRGGNQGGHRNRGGRRDRPWNHGWPKG